MAIHKTEAFVLKSTKLGETSKIITFYTRQFGLEKMVAKGARGGKSRFFGTLEPLNHLFIIFYLKANRDLQFLSQAEIINPFTKIRKDLRQTTYALAICEMLFKTQLPAEPNFLLFNLVSDAFSAINQTKYSPLNIFLGFQLKFLDIAGVNPDFNNCLGCRREVVDEPVIFKVDSGGIICRQCANHAEGLAISAKGLRYLKWLRAHSMAEISQYSIPTELLNLARKSLADYIDCHIDGLKKLKALEFLSQI